MNYIVFDLEWNQCPQGKQKEDKRLPFEIIEIGAWKLNEDREIVDKFHAFIKPQVYHGIHFRTQEVIHMDMANLKKGCPFPAAAREFLEWCGEDYRFCSWGDLDLTEFQRNLKYYHMEAFLTGPLYYYNVQKLFSKCCEDGRSRRSLEYAIDFMELPKEKEFHRALEDAWYTAIVFQRLDMQCIQTYYSIDVYQNPKNRKEELHVSYPGYDKYVSREFLSKEAAMRDREVCSTRCICCHKAARKKIRWFSANNRRYFSVSFCGEHGYMRGKIRIKKTDEGKYYVVKTLRPMGDEEVADVMTKQEMIRKRRNLKGKKARSNNKIVDK